MKKLVLVAIALILSFAGINAQNISNPFFDQVLFRGAFGSTNWTEGWANWDPQNTNYAPANKIIPGGDISQNQVWKNSPLLKKADFTDQDVNTAFFEKVDFIGAFGTTDWTEGWANWDPQNTTYPAATVTIPGGDISSNTTWTNNNVYLLDGWVYVVDGVTLTIEPGTVIRGSKANKGALIVEPGGKIIARGTKEQPIVFTSNEPAGQRSYGDWGGLVVCGRAKVNKANPQIEGGPRTVYGGTNDADSSGVLSYIRIEFPGIAFQPDKEINGLTLGGVGSKTQIDHIQVSYCGDDSYEWFGGTVNAKYLIAYKGWDDDFDTDYGFRGLVQFGVSLRDPQIADPGSKSNSFESDNDGSGSAAEPFTSPVFSNISSFGPLATPSTQISGDYLRAMHLRRNTKIKIFNSVFAGWPTGLFIEGPSIENAKNGELKVRNCVMSGMTADFGVKSGESWPDAAAEAAWYFTSSFKNDTLSSNNELLVVDPFKQTGKPNFSPVTGYLLDGWVYVVDGVTLTIEPGTVIRGSKANKGALIVEPGGKIIARGTKEQPIVFTSNEPAGQRSYGDWGGLVVCGRAKVNKANPQIEGGPRTVYGGTNDADSSGVLSYIRIEFPGIAFQPDKEINGLTLGGVGSKTQIDHIQVSYCGDDSYEWFGGTVNAKYLIAYKGWDDDFDTDYGFRGLVQFGVSLRDPQIADPGSKSNSFESDNDGSGSAAEPFTSPVFSNISSFGPLATPSTQISGDYLRAMHLRRNTKIQIYNSLFAGWPTGLYIEGFSIQNAKNDELKLYHSVMAGMTNFFGVKSGEDWPTAAEEAAWYLTASRSNDTLISNSQLKIADPFVQNGTPNFLPLAGSPVLRGSIWDVTSVNKVTAKNNVLVYPNPATETITVSSDAPIMSITVTNLLGQTIQQLNSVNQKVVTINVSDLHNGIYFLVTRNADNTSAAVKFMKK